MEKEIVRVAKSLKNIFNKNIKSVFKPFLFFKNKPNFLKRFKKIMAFYELFLAVHLISFN